MQIINFYFFSDFYTSYYIWLNIISTYILFYLFEILLSLLLYIYWHIIHLNDF